MGSLTHWEHLSSHIPTFRELLRVFLIREIVFFPAVADAKLQNSRLAPTHLAGEENSP